MGILYTVYVAIGRLIYVLVYVFLMCNVHFVISLRWFVYIGECQCN